MAGISIRYPNDYVYYIVDKNSEFATVMQKNIRDLTICEIEEIDKNGYYFSTEELAKVAIK